MNEATYHNAALQCCTPAIHLFFTDVLVIHLFQSNRKALVSRPGLKRDKSMFWLGALVPVVPE
jgi:hypothetical protein